MDSHASLVKAPSEIQSAAAVLLLVAVIPPPCGRILYFFFIAPKKVSSTVTSVPASSPRIRIVAVLTTHRTSLKEYYKTNLTIYGPGSSLWNEYILSIDSRQNLTCSWKVLRFISSYAALRQRLLKFTSHNRYLDGKLRIFFPDVPVYPGRVSLCKYINISRWCPPFLHSHPEGLLNYQSVIR